MIKLAEKTHTTEEIKNKWEHYYTVGQLRKFLEENKDIPDDAKIFIQRVEDVYFEEHHWGTIKIEGDMYWSEKRLIEKANPGGEFHDKEQYPKMTQERIDEILKLEETLDECKDEYVAVWWVFKYKDDKNGIFLTPHY